VFYQINPRLWPLTAIETSAMKNVIDKDGDSKNRIPEIMSDAAFCVLSQPVEYSGNFCIDEVFVIVYI
jgi:citronellol/citronellal dehydrogenase